MPNEIPNPPVPGAVEAFGGSARWLRIESLRRDAVVGWASGSILSGSNIIEIATQGARCISLDLSEIHVDWSRRVILRIDGQGSELRHGKVQIKYLEATESGRWRTLRPEDAAARFGGPPTD